MMRDPSGVLLDERVFGIVASSSIAPLVGLLVFAVAMLVVVTRAGRADL